MERRSTEPTPRNEEVFQFIREKFLTTDRHDIEGQNRILAAVEEFFKPEIDEALAYSGKLRSFHGYSKADRLRALKDIAMIEIYQQLVFTPEQAEDFEECILRFRKKIREVLLEETSHAHRETCVPEKRAVNGRRSGEGDNGGWSIRTGKKDITEDVINPNHQNEEPQETEEDVAERHGEIPQVLQI